MKLTNLLSLPAILLFACCGGGSSSVDMEGKINVFKDKAIAYEKCVSSTPTACAGQFEKMETEMNELSKEINEKVSAESDWKENDHLNTMLKEIWGEVRMSHATEQIK